MLYRELIAVCTEIRTGHINTVWTERRIVIVEPGGHITTGLSKVKRQKQGTFFQQPWNFFRNDEQRSGFVQIRTEIIYVATVKSWTIPPWRGDRRMTYKFFYVVRDVQAGTE
jgi:hypothetical protein